MYEIEIPRQIGQAIKNKRLKKGFTQEQLAKLSNTSRSLVYRLEKGTTNGVSLDKLFEILQALDLKFAIIDLDDAPKNIEQNTTSLDLHSTRKRIKKRPSTITANNTAGKNDSSRNSRAQREKELRAIQNIKALNAQMNSRR